MYPKSSVSSVRINPQLKELFEGTQQLHHRTLSDAMEEGIIQTLKHIMPVAIIENQIEETRKRLSDLEASLSYARRIEEETVRKLDPVEQINPVYLERREELFKTGPGTVIFQLKKNQTPAWDRVYHKYGFSNARELETYVREEAIKRGIL